MQIPNIFSWLRRGASRQVTVDHLGAAIEAIVRTAAETGRIVDVGAVADRLLRDFSATGVTRAEVATMIAAACARHVGVAVLLDGSAPSSSPREE